jgi:uridylate kinase
MKPYKRIIVKLSGELLGTEKRGGHLNFGKIAGLADTLKKLSAKKCEVGIVMGAGNIFRARMIQGTDIDRVSADHMGMMGTIINSLALQASLSKAGVDARVLSAIQMNEIMENYVHKRAINHFNNGRIVIFAGGTGRPFFTTDTTAVIRALEVNADVVLKASNVAGVYDRDPKRSKKAKKYDELAFSEALGNRLHIMDATSFALAQENNLPIIVFKYSPKNLFDVAAGKKVGTLIHS